MNTPPKDRMSHENDKVRTRSDTTPGKSGSTPDQKVRLETQEEDLFDKFLEQVRNVVLSSCLRFGIIDIPYY